MAAGLMPAKIISYRTLGGGFNKVDDGVGAIAEIAFNIEFDGTLDQLEGNHAPTTKKEDGQPQLSQ